MVDGFSVADLINPELYIQLGGLWVVLFIVFAETGLFFGFFFPGDSLLFVSGIYAQDIITRYFDVSSDWCVWMLILFTALAAIIGNMVGYFIGSKSRNFFHHAKDNWFYKKKYLMQAHDFYEKHGGFALTFARFVPIIRTFVPVVAGIVEMQWHKFLMFTIIGGVLWPLILQAGGYYLYHFLLDRFDFDIKHYIEIIVIGIIIVTTVPVIYNFIKGNRKKS